jgi:hypothetical protein
MYLVYGWDRKTDDTVILWESDSRESAVRWAKSYVSGAGGMGGWDKIYVSDLYQVDVDWDGEPVTEEQIIWSCWNEPMSWSDNAMEEF